MGVAEDRRKWNQRYAEASAPPPATPHPLALAFQNHVPPGPLLDAACGLGRGIAALHTQCAPCIGVDLSDVVLRHAAQHWAGHPQVRFIAGDVNTLQWPAAHFAAICAFGFTDWGFFARVPALLKPGALFIYEGFSRERLRTHPRMDVAWTSTEAELRAMAPKWPVLHFEVDPEHHRNRFILQRPLA